MRFTRVGYALGVAAAVAIFAGCSSNGSSSSLGSVAPMPGTQSVVRNHPVMLLPQSVISQLHLGDIPSRGHNWQGVQPNAITTYVTGCQFFGVNCNMYVKGHNTVVGTIAASYVNGMCVDKAGNVWIPDGGATTISEYPHGSTTASFTLAGDGNQPSACAVDSNGTVYVADIAAATIQVYKAGATTPFRTLKVKKLLSGTTVQGYIIGLAVDESPSLHNLATSWINFSTGASGIDEFTSARQKGEHTVISTGSDFLGGVTFDKAENLVWNDQTTGLVNVGTSCSFGYVSGDAVVSSLDKSNALDYVGDAVNNVVDAITYSSTCSGAGVLKKTYSHFASGSSVIGTAVSPGSTN